MKVAVLGASPKPGRYAHQAVRRLMEQGHEVIPVNPAYDRIESLPVTKSLAELPAGSVDTLTLYLGPDRTRALVDDIRTLRPRRVIFNPGTENPVLADRLRADGVEVLEACTLVLLKTGQF